MAWLADGDDVADAKHSKERSANPANRRAAKAVLAVSEDRLLFETDAPDIPPVPDTLNEPAHIRLVAEAAARLRSDSLEEVAAQA